MGSDCCRLHILKKGGFNNEDAQWGKASFGGLFELSGFRERWVNEKNIWTKQHFYPQSFLSPCMAGLLWIVGRSRASIATSELSRSARCQRPTRPSQQLRIKDYRITTTWKAQTSCGVFTKKT